MNRPFWSRRIEPDSCESIEPLLPLYADRMASLEEMRRVDAHLPNCERCRAALAWMQATHRALAARPVALPPADLHSRIAQAIAASSAAPPLTPGVLRPARSFILRPAYAAAASLSVLGIILSASYSLWHPESAGVKPAPLPVHIASAPHREKPHSAAVPRFAPARSHVASAVPEDRPAMRPVVTPKKTVPSSIMPKESAVPKENAVPREQIANAVPVPVLPSVPARLKVLRQPAATPYTKIASIKDVPTEKRQPQALKALPAPKLSVTPKAPNAPLVARQDKEPISVPIVVRPFTVTPEVPPVQTASAASRPKSDDSMSKLADFAQKLRNSPYAPSRFTVRQASTGAASAVQALGSEPVAYYGAIHSDTTIK